MTCPVDVLVAVPAHDEEEGIDACLSSVIGAVEAARRTGAVRRALVAVAAHNCQDATAVLAKQRLSRQQTAAFLVTEDLDSTAVGAVRHELVVAARAALAPERASRCWVFSTDADSEVPPGWVTETLELAYRSAAAVVVGTVQLHGWHAPDAAQQDYAAIIGRGLRPGGHDHVYAANLAVRLDAYESVGGFPSQVHGEDRALVTALHRGGWPVITPLAPTVRTSARMPGRAAGGLGDLLLRLTRRLP